LCGKKTSSGQTNTVGGLWRVDAALYGFLFLLGVFTICKLE
jgi:hypothetical protein